MKLIQGDCLEVLSAGSLKADCIFADPPDNIGLGYGEYKDSLPDAEYVRWFGNCLGRFITAAPIVWVSFNAKWTFAFGAMFNSFVNNHKDWEAKACVQVFTFGQHRDSDLGNNHRPLWRLKRKDAPLYPDQIRVPSWRQRHGDKRACSKGRVPGDVFDMQPAGNTRLSDAELADTFARTLSGKVSDWPQLRPLLGRLAAIADDPRPGDVFDFPRVTGNSKQRCDWHPTQLHEELVERCIKLSTKEGQHVLDPFGGTGTTMRVCKQINRDCTLIEYDRTYCEKIAEACDLTEFDEGIWVSTTEEAKNERLSRARN